MSTCVTLILPDKWEILVNRLGRRTRRELFYDRRHLAKHFAVELKELRGESEVRSTYADLAKIYSERWNEHNGSSRYTQGQSSLFEQQICRLLSRQQALRVWVLYLDNEPAGCLSGYISQQKIFADLFAYSPRYRRFSVGSVLLGVVIEQCITEGIAELDLSRGEESYRYRAGGAEKYNFGITEFLAK